MKDINILVFGDSITYGAWDKEKDVDYLYIYDLLEIEELFDGLHPNNVGHQKICDKVKNKISKYF